MAIRGVFTSHSGIQGDTVGDFSSEVLMHMPQGSASLLALSSGMPREDARDVSFTWLEDEFINGVGAASAQTASGATTLPVADTTLWTPNTILLNVDTDERMLITAISGLNLTVVRGIAGTTAAQIETTHVLQNIGTAFGEGSGKPTSISQRGESRSNFCQIFKNGWSITGTASAIGYHTGDQLAQNREQCAAYHAEDIEKNAWWGKKGFTTLNNQAVYLSDGLFEQITNFGGTIESAAYGGQSGEMSMQGIMDFMRVIFDVNVRGAPNERIAFTSSLTLGKINQMARMDSVYNLKEVDTAGQWGFKMHTIEGMNGDLKIMTHPLFSSTGRNELVVTHPTFIKKRILRDTKSQEFDSESNTNAGVDATEGFLLTQLGWQVGGARTMGIMDTITTPVASFS